MEATNVMELLQRLRQLQGQWLVSIKPMETGEAITAETWQAHLTLVSGQLLTCRVHSQVDGRLLLRDREALGWLARLRHFAWSMEPTRFPMVLTPAAMPSQPSLPPWMPRRTSEGKKEIMQGWSRKQRQIFGLVDGNRSVEQIATLLHQPIKAVEHALDELRTMGDIE